MGRLTSRVSESVVVYTQGKYEDTIPAEMTSGDIRKVLWKLAEYEDLEEHGLLLKLPCKVGATIYVVGTKCLADKEPDDDWCDRHDCEECVFDKEYIVFNTKASPHLIYIMMQEYDEIGFLAKLFSSQKKKQNRLWKG